MSRTDLVIIYPMDLAEYTEMRLKVARGIYESLGFAWRIASHNDEFHYMGLAKAALKAIGIEEPL